MSATARTDQASTGEQPICECCGSGAELCDDFCADCPSTDDQTQPVEVKCKDAEPIPKEETDCVTSSTRKRGCSQLPTGQSYKRTNTGEEITVNLHGVAPGVVTTTVLRSTFPLPMFDGRPIEIHFGDFCDVSDHIFPRAPHAHTLILALRLKPPT